MAPTARKILSKVSSSGKSLTSTPFQNAFTARRKAAVKIHPDRKIVHAPPLQGKGTRYLREGCSGLSRRMGMTPWQRTMSSRKR